MAAVAAGQLTFVCPSTVDEEIPECRWLSVDDRSEVESEGWELGQSVGERVQG